MGVVDDEMLFGGKVGADGGEEGDEEDSAFVMFVSSRLDRFYVSCRLTMLPYNRGGFTDDLGEDFLGLKELGIASEFGLSSLSVPKKLLRGKKGVKPAFVPCVHCPCSILFPLSSSFMS